MEAESFLWTFLRRMVSPLFAGQAKGRDLSSPERILSMSSVRRPSTHLPSTFAQTAPPHPARHSTPCTVHSPSAVVSPRRTPRRAHSLALQSSAPLGASEKCVYSST